MQRSEQKIRKGFTLIELSFAIAFIGTLLLTVTLITNEIVSTYRKGYSIKSVNQVGRDLIDDLQNAITQAPPAASKSFCDLYSDGTSDRTKCESNNGFYSVYQQFYAKTKVTSGTEVGDNKFVPIGGIFCSGQYSYIWNTGYLFNNDNSYDWGGNNPETYKLSFKYKIGSETKTRTNFRLLKVIDSGGNICKNSLTASYPGANDILTAPGSTGATASRAIELSDALSSEPEEMLAVSDANLALFDLVIFPPAHVVTTGRMLFSGSFILGTTTGGVDIMTSSNYCQAPALYTADFNYCAINKFNFTIQASGEQS